MSEKSPYVSIYMARRQAEEVAKVVRWAAEGKAKSNPLWRALKVIEEALGKNDEETSADDHE